MSYLLRKNGCIERGSICSLFAPTIGIIEQQNIFAPVILKNVNLHHHMKKSAGTQTNFSA